MSISVLILTLNEEANLPRCLEAVRWSDDIVIFDSYSSDRTLEIAERAGARIFQRRFDNERDHRAASLRLPFKHPWVFNPDADEVATPALSREMLARVRGSEPYSAYRVRFRAVFMGRWLKHSSLYPTWIVRLFRPEAILFERSVNLRVVTSGSEGRLENHLLHYSFEKGLDAWFEKHNKYSSAEAIEMCQALRQRGFLMRDLFTANPLRRRRALKELSFRMPFRGECRFLYTYILRGGFLEGYRGLEYCRLMAIYDSMISMKARALLVENSEKARALHVEHSGSVVQADGDTQL
jgi:glycosyltransferase involved in cell wall biosynthesis